MSLVSDEVLGHVVGEETLFLFWCPGCECAHHLDTKRWTWNGDMVKPTASPSLRIYSDGHLTKCHLLMRDGKLQLLSDCTHKLADKTVDMVPWAQAGRPVDLPVE